MNLKIFFFAELRERMNREFIESEFQGVKNIRDCKKNSRKIRSFERMFCGGQVDKIAINHEYCSLDAELRDGDEVAFFPPVTGG